MGKEARIAGSILTICGLLCITVLGYVIYRYGWSGEESFTSPAAALLYIGLPALLAGVCFASLRLPPSYRSNAALLVASTGVSLYAVELMLTLWFSLPSVKAQMTKIVRAEAAERYGVDFDTRTKLEIFHDLRKAGVDAYPIGDPKEVLDALAGDRAGVVPLGWISNAVSILCNESGKYVIYESDERGFHNPKGLWDAGKVEIVALGDSYVQGYCVPSSKNFVALVRERYPTTLNLGMAGHGPLFMLATLKEYAESVRPQIVLWFYYEGNDLTDLRREWSNPLLIRYTEADFRQGLVDRQGDVDRALRTYVEGLGQMGRTSRWLAELVEALGDPAEILDRPGRIMKLSRLRSHLGLVQASAAENRPGSSPNQRRFESELTLLGRSLLEARETVASWGGKLYFIYLPDFYRYTRPDAVETDRARVLRTATELGLPVIDIHEVFQAQKDPLDLFPFRLHSHYNETGHRLVAEAVLRSVARR